MNYFTFALNSIKAQTSSREEKKDNSDYFYLMQAAVEMFDNILSKNISAPEREWLTGLWIRFIRPDADYFYTDENIEEIDKILGVAK